MSNRIIDGTPLPGTKSDLKGLPAQADTSKWLVAAEWNDLARGWIGDTRDIISALVPNFVKLASNPSQTISGSGNVTLRSNAGVLQSSSNAFEYRPVHLQIHASEFGVKADGATDDYAALQATLDFAKDEIDAGRACDVMLPRGVMRVTDTPVMRGNSGSSPRLLGEQGRGDTQSNAASIIQWDGDDLGIVFFTEGVNVGMIRDVQFHGANKAGVLFAYSATTFEDRAVLAASNDFIWERCRFFGVKIGTEGTACVQLGTDTSLTSGDTFEAATGTFRNCVFDGEDPGAPGFAFAGMKVAGARNMAGGNAKIFRYEDCSWRWCNIALDNTRGSGQVVVTNFQMGNVRQCFQHFAGELIVHGGDAECADVDDFVIYKGANLSYARIHGCEFVGFMAGDEGVAVDGVGYLQLEHCYIRNMNSSVSGDANDPNPFRLYVGGEIEARSGFRSKANWYYNCGSGTDNSIPIYDNSSNQNAVWAAADYGASKQLAVSSEDDIGGTGESPIPFADFKSDATTMWSALFNGPLALKQQGAVGDDTNPNYKFVVQNAGINRPELAIFCKSDELPNWFKVFGLEMTGTMAAVRDGTLGSGFELFRRDGDPNSTGAEGGGPGAFKPLLRLNSYPTMGIELMANGGQIAAGALTRSSNVVTGVVKDSAGNAIPHGFYPGLAIKMTSNDPSFTGGDKTIASTPGGDTFTYNETGSNGSSTTVTDVSAEFDVRVERAADGTLRFIIHGQTVAVFYQDAMVMQQGSFFVDSAQEGITAHSGGGQPSATQLTCSENHVSTVAADNDSCKMPFTGNGAGRKCYVYNGGSHILTLWGLMGGDTIDGASSVDVPVGTSVLFHSFNGGWRS